MPASEKDVITVQERETGGGANKREGQQEIERGAAGEPGTGKKSAKGEANGAKNTATKEAKKSLTKKAKTTAEKVCPPIL